MQEEEGFGIDRNENVVLKVRYEAEIDGRFLF